MDILVIGATGGSGRAVCDALLERGHRVTALARHASAISPRPGLNPIDGDVTDDDLLDRVMPGHEAVVVTLGISEPALRVRVRGAKHTPSDVRSRGTAAVVAAARRAGLRRIVVQSSYGVTDRLLFALLIAPQIADTAVQEGVLRGSGLDWTIVQPVYLSDDDSDDHFVSTDGSRRRRKVSRRGVARVHADLVEQGSMIGRTVSVSG
jgi:uncharacterized protein YbjT (DUF2867 family)